MHPGFFELARPLDVAGFVEAGTQLDHGRDLLAVLHRVHQRADDARVAAGAVERLLDGEHLRVFRRQFEKLDDAVEGVVRVMQQNVPLGDGGEQVALPLERRYDGCNERGIAQLGGMIAMIDRHEPRGIERAVDDIHVLVLQSQRAEQRLADFRRAIVFHFEPHGVALAAVVQFVLHGLEQVLDVLLVNVEFAVAGHAEMAVAENFRAGEEVAEKVPDELAHEHEVRALLLTRQPHQARQHARHLHHGEMLEHLPVLRHLQLDDHVQ